MIGLYLYQTTLADFLRPRRILAWLAALGSIFGFTLLFLRTFERVDQADAYTNLSAILVFRVLALASAIFSTAVISQEVEQKTIVYLVTRPVSRALILAARALAAMTVVFLIASLGALLVSFAVYGGSFLANEFLWRDLRALAVGALAYGSLFVLISLWVNRAMLVCLIYAFAWEALVPNVSGNLGYLSVFAHLGSIAERPSTAGVGPGVLNALAGQFGVGTIPTATAWSAMVGLILVAFGVAMWWFSRFEYLPREDAE